MATRISVDVTNEGCKGVIRGGRFFPPLKTTTVLVSKYQLKEIRAHVDLFVDLPEEVEDTQAQDVSDTQAQNDEFKCPYCEEYQGSSRVGLMSHVRQAHEELYEEFKERG